MADAPAGYDASKYPPFAVTVDIVLLTVRDGMLQVLLVERAGEPYQGSWALPGGFVDINEDLHDAAVRELAEETGIDRFPAGFHLEQLRTYGAPGRDPRMRVVSVGHVALLPPTVADPKAGSDASQARWWPVADLGLGLFADEDTSDAPTLAFDHATIVADGVQRARAKLEYATIVTSFVDEPFTILNLRRIYESVWGARLHSENFRRKVLSIDGFVEPQDATGVPTSGGGRPARLYRAGDATEIYPPFQRVEPGGDQSWR